jgi:DNA-binding NtrC family response regulator
MRCSFPDSCGAGASAWLSVRILYAFGMGRLGRVLLLEDDADVVKAVRMALSREAEQVDAIERAEEVAAAMTGPSYDVALLDMNLAPGEHSGHAGLEALEAIRAADESLSVVLMTVYGGVALAVEALKRGAADFLLKPWRNDRLVEALAAAAGLTRDRRASADLTLDRLEKHAIERALARYDGNISQAAAALGLTRPALYRRMEKHGL